jgi:hypothetical protein
MTRRFRWPLRAEAAASGLFQNRRCSGKAPMSEVLGELLLELDRPSEALAAYPSVLTESPNRFNSPYGGGRVPVELQTVVPSGPQNTAHVTKS